ncbi:Oligoendopeptidase F, plasmid [Solibacillus isronensis B3W22]|uniref:Oligopeptidase F n=1 Tax=Solibacillus isronensis B3W22 TaxID=1224748 RepID=K1LSM2_9BACL|nr:oligoendopeptidase F [Solibacillus isronensis]AMO84450.1 oligoendopeptidase F [Solibacillus silvestris]EKB47119.1 Oligoendopeptidase F, plasmid [Solibacillus isronensis B3W22]
MAKQILTREEVPEQLTWDLTSIFESDEAWEAELKEVEQLSKQASNYKGKVADSANSLYNTLQFSDALYERLHKLYVYSHLKHDQDTTNSKYQDLDGRVRSVLTNVGAAWSFITPEILALDEATLNSYVESYEPLSLYEQSLKELNLGRPHILSAEKEELLAQFSEVTSTAGKTFSALNNADLEFPKIKGEDGEEVQITHGNYITMLESDNREVREAAFKAVYKTYGQYKNTFATTLAGNVKAHNVNAKVRNYNSARHAALSNNFIPEKVYDQLVSTIHDYLPALHRYVELRKKVLGVDELHMYDLFTPLVKEVKMEVTYDEAKKTMVESFAPLGKEYQEIVEKGLESRWVDVLENKGKRSGAYSSGTFGTNPYVLMNWQNNVNNLYTLAHEFGHSMHSYYSRANQPYQYSDYSIFVAEVASTCNEELLFDHLMKTLDDDKQKIYLLNQWLDGFRGTVFRQTMFAEFEHMIHELDAKGESITSEKLTSIYYDLNKKYFGDAMTVDEEIGLEWARIPHFYYNYYVYQYATGQSAATALSKQILEEGEPAVERYINNFLKAGCSDFPIEVLKAAGVDMESPEPIALACQVFEEKLEELEKLLLNN